MQFVIWATLGLTSSAVISKEGLVNFDEWNKRSRCTFVTFGIQFRDEPISGKDYRQFELVTYVSGLVKDVASVAEFAQLEKELDEHKPADLMGVRVITRNGVCMSPLAVELYSCNIGALQDFALLNMDEDGAKKMLKAAVEKGKGLADEKSK
jgi:hypothetical protein